MTDTTYDNLPLSVQRREDQGMYVLGVTIDGAFIPFASRKLGGVDDDIRRAREEAAEVAAKSEQQSQQPATPPAQTEQ